jgi:hypothetical protein
LAKDLVVFRRRDVTIVQSGDDRAVRVWKLPLAVGGDRPSMPKTAPILFRLPASWETEINLQSRYPGGIFVTKIGAAESAARKGWGRRKRDNTCHYYNSNQQQNDTFHSGFSLAIK